MNNKSIKKSEYNTPEIEVIALSGNNSVLFESNGNGVSQPGVPSEDEEVW